MYLRACANLFAEFTDTKTLARLMILFILYYSTYLITIANYV
jgi:hypothetical protein